MATKSLQMGKKWGISIFYCAFFNQIIDKHQQMHFFTFKTVLIYNVNFNVKIHKNI